jgi:hypothetical protein
MSMAIEDQKGQKQASPRGADAQLAEELVARARSEGLELTGPDGLLGRVTKAVLEGALRGELDDHLGYAKHEAAGRDGANSRNGTRSKTVLTDIGPVDIEVPRDRDGSFEPKIVRKRQRRLSGIDELVISLSAKGLTTGEVAAHLAEVYGAQVSKQTISTITDRVLEGLGEWQSRPLEPIYPVIFVDAITVKIRDGQVANRPIYVAMAVTCEGERDILGLWAGEHGDGEGAKFWMRVLTEIKNRGTKDCCLVVCDGLKGLPEAIGQVWPAAITQTSSIHNDHAGMVPVVTCTVAGRTYADASPSRSSTQTRPSGAVAGFASVSGSSTRGWRSAEMRFRRGRPCGRGRSVKEQCWTTSTHPAQRTRYSPGSTGAVHSTRSA